MGVFPVVVKVRVISNGCRSVKAEDIGQALFVILDPRLRGDDVILETLRFPEAFIQRPDHRIEEIGDNRALPHLDLGSYLHAGHQPESRRYITELIRDKGDAGAVEGCRRLLIWSGIEQGLGIVALEGILADHPDLTGQGIMALEGKGVEFDPGDIAGTDATDIL